MKSVLTSTLLFLFIACTNYDIDPPQLEPMLAASGLIEDDPNSSSELWLGYANTNPGRSFLNNIDDALVGLSHNGIEVASFQSEGAGRYVTQDTLREGLEYTLKVLHTDFELNRSLYYPVAPEVQLVSLDSNFNGYLGDTIFRYKTTFTIKNIDAQLNQLKAQILFGTTVTSPIYGVVRSNILRVDPAIKDQYRGLFVLNLNKDESKEMIFYSRFKWSFTFHFFSDSLYEILLNEDQNTNDFGTFYQPPPTTASDFSNALGFFGWKHSAILNVE